MRDGDEEGGMELICSESWTLVKELVRKLDERDPQR
jgi:hypothetical protein